MTEFSRQAIRQSGYLRAGFADQYDAFRPSPPPVLLEALSRYAGPSPLRRVVDLGSGTGLSTRAWAARADEVVGIEPNPEMRKAAELRTSQENVRYVEAFADRTGLESASADLVTCSQSFHWMERGPVLAEAARILRARRGLRGIRLRRLRVDRPGGRRSIRGVSPAAPEIPRRAQGRGRLDADAEVRPPRRHPRERPLRLHARVRRPRRARSGRRGDRRVRAKPRPRAGTARAGSLRKTTSGSPRSTKPFAG